MKKIKTYLYQWNSLVFFKNGCVLILCFFCITLAVEESDSLKNLEKTIKELNTKIANTRKQTHDIKEKIKNDNQSFLKYKNQYEDHFGRQKNELDTLKNDYSRLQVKTDSLVTRILEVKQQYAELDLLQNRFTQLILNSCKKLKETLLLLPPSNIQKQITAIDFLHSELVVKAVDNVEALERLWQILSVLSEGSQSIEVFPGQSPVPFISNQVDFIRLGYAYLAIVNEKGTSGALWIPPKDSIGGQWKEIENPQQLLSLKKCVNIRQGNSVPEIVGIPFKHAIISDTKDTEGSNK